VRQNCLSRIIVRHVLSCPTKASDFVNYKMYIKRDNATENVKFTDVHNLSITTFFISEIKKEAVGL